MKHQIKNHGFQTPRITSDHYIVGANDTIPKIVLQPNANWSEFLPVFEKQFNEELETYGCTSFGTLNIIEMLKRRIYPPEKNYSDRYSYIISGTQPPGNDPHIVAEAIRNNGLIEESELPFSPKILSLDQFTSLEGREKEFMISTKVWKDKFDFKHAWLFNTNIPLRTKQQLMMEYLVFGPLGVSVRAWLQKENGLYYKEIGEVDTHWCVCIGFVEGKHWIIYDSYPNSGGEAIKYLEWDYDFGFVKRYCLQVKDANKLVETTSSLKKLMDIIIKFLKEYLI